MKPNLIISPSQQTGVEEDIMRPLGQALYDAIKKDGLINAFIVPAFVGLKDMDALKASVKWSNDCIKKNKLADAYHLALHADAGYNGSGVSGFYYGSPGGKGYLFGKAIYDALCALTPWTDMSYRRRDGLLELNATDAHAALIEVSFYDQPLQKQFMIQKRTIIANNIKSAIYAYFKIKVVTTK